MLAGHVNGKKTSLSQMFEAVGAYQAGKLDDAGLRKCEQSSCPSCGSCSGMFTANSMNCLCEALGMDCAIKKADIRAEAASQHTGLEDAGRRARYAWLEELRRRTGSRRR